MGKIIKDATPEQEKAFIEERRKFAFLAACKWPISWLIAAERHKHAADILYETAHKANERKLARDIKRFREQVKKGITVSESRYLEGEELSDYQDSNLFSDYLLLAGYALECIMKGFLLARQPELVKNDEELHSSIITHNLSQLCENCGITLSKKEQQVIEVMNWHILWGKYPAPKKIEDMPSPVEPSKRGIDVKGSVFHNRQVQNLVDDLYRRAYILLESVRNSKPTSSVQ